MEFKFLVFFTYFIYLVRANNRLIPEKGMTVPQLIRHHGYPLEIHTVITEDGYILTMQRIPHGRNSTVQDLASGVKREPVFLQHGLAASASCWVANLPHQSLAFILADSGFDVWLGNVRGNRYSNQHVTLSNWRKKFWDFSWEEMAEYDLPSMVDLILNKTHFRQLSYVGHSQGTLIAFAKLSEDKLFSQKVKTFFALAPVSTVGHITSPIRHLAPYYREIKSSLNLVFQHSLKTITWLFKVIKPYCDRICIEELRCGNIISSLVGDKWKNALNETRIPVYLTNHPEGTSIKNLAHFAQMVNSDNMQKYDYGADENKRIYGKYIPPKYNVENVEVPTVIFWSPNDTLAGTGDVKTLLPKLKNLQQVYHLETYTHLDFIWALSAKDLIYQKIVDHLKRG